MSASSPSPSTVQLTLPPRGVLRPNNAHDPLPYYYDWRVGWLYRHRLQMGLDLLPAGGRRVLEIGVGSGVLVPTLTRHFPAYVGTDLELAPDLASLVAPGCDARFETADLLAWKETAHQTPTSAEVFASASASLAPESFDAIVCFSVLEHIADAAGAARGLARLLARGGTLVTGYPMVSPLMSRLFSLIGFSGIDDHHVSPPARIHAALARELSLRARVAFPPHAPIPAALYQCSAWTKP